MKVHLSFIPGKVQHLAAACARLGQEIKAALQSQKAIDIEAMIDAHFPDAAGLRDELIKLATRAISTCTILATDDWTGVTSRLQRLDADTTRLLHGNKHDISTYIQWGEVVIRDILEGGTGVNKDASDESE